MIPSLRLSLRPCLVGQLNIKTVKYFLDTEISRLQGIPSLVSVSKVNILQNEISPHLFQYPSIFLKQISLPHFTFPLSVPSFQFHFLP